MEIPDFVHLLDVKTLFPSRKQRGIVTVHDLYHKHRTYGSKKFMDKLIERLLPWDYILSDSHASIPELESVDFSEDQIKVVHLAVRDGIWFKMDEEEISGLIQEKFPIICQVQKPIVLTVGDAKHKNNHLTNEAV